MAHPAYERCGLTGKVCWPDRRTATQHARPDVKVFRCGYCLKVHTGRPRGRGGGRA